MIEWLRWIVDKFQVPTWEELLYAIAVITVGYILQKYVISYCVKLLNLLLIKGKKPFLARIVNETQKAVRYAFFTVILFIGLSFFLEGSLFDSGRTGDILTSLFVLYIFLGIYDVLEYFAKHPKSFHLFSKDDEIIKPYIIRLFKVITIVLSVFVIASSWNFNLNGFLTGIGLTGVAVAFSVRETLTHIVSGMSIALDRPFQIGDWITTEDQKIDGIVQDINLRSTLIDTPDKGLVYVPNSYLVNKPIFNLANRPKRKCEFYTYLASSNEEEKLRKLCMQLHEQITLHPMVEREFISVSIDEIYAHSFRMYIRFFVSTNDLGELLQVKQDILFALHEMIIQDEIVMAQVQEEVVV